eukprot:3993562-Lingulodinium_polyedra.AAC.1
MSAVGRRTRRPLLVHRLLLGAERAGDRLPRGLALALPGPGPDRATALAGPAARSWPYPEERPA